MKSNGTDPERALIKSSYGYEGRGIGDRSRQIIVVGEGFGSGKEGEQFPRMLDALKGRMRALTGEAEPVAQAVVLGDRGYVSEDNQRAAKERKIEVLIPDPQFRSRVIKAEEKGSVQPKQRFAAEDFTYK